MDVSSYNELEFHVSFLVLCAALLHASWNAMLKGGSDKLLDGMLLLSVRGAVCIASLPFLPLPHPDSWPYLLTFILHILYFYSLSKIYETGELSITYSIMRGLPPLVVSLFMFLVMDENITPAGWAGIIAISVGVVTIEFTAKAPSLKAFTLSVVTACVIASYIVIDGLGARRSGNVVSFLMCFSLLQSVGFVLIALRLRGIQKCKDYAVKYWRRGLVGGTMSFLGYAILVWAATKAPISYVSALNSTSVLFASVIASMFLSESVKTNRALSSVVIVFGIVLVKLS